MALKSIVVNSLCLLGIAILLVSPAPLPLFTVKGEIGSRVILPCDGSAYRGTPDNKMDVLWQTEDGEMVAHYSTGALTIATSFKDRVKFHQEIRRGNFSITIDPLFYNDAMHYECFWNKRLSDEKFLQDVILQVLEPSLPTSLSVSAGDPVTLLCYGRINKQTPDNELFVQWKRGEEVVLQLSSGELTYGTEFKGRASVSQERIKQGNFSLSLRATRLSDQGVYQCSTDKNRIGTSVILTLEGNNEQRTTSITKEMKPRNYYTAVFIVVITGIVLCIIFWCLFSNIIEQFMKYLCLRGSRYNAPAL